MIIGSDRFANFNKPRGIPRGTPRASTATSGANGLVTSHRVYAVTKNGERNFWQPIGAAWAHGDGEGFNLKLDFLPLDPEADIVIRKPKAEVDPADAVPEIETA